MKFIELFWNAFRAPELRRRLLFTLAMLAVYRLGSNIPLPGIDIGRLAGLANGSQNDFWGMANLLSGGNFTRMTVFALGVTPYISASIMLQILGFAIPSLERLHKEGEAGRKKIARWTRYLTVPIAAGQALATARMIETMPGELATVHGFGFYLLTALSLTAGTLFVMWLGERITDRGIGNGVSLVIFAGIVTNLPKAMESLYVNTFVTHEWGLLELVLIVAVTFGVVAFVAMVESGDRRIPIQYAKRITGRRIMGCQTQHMPLKVNAAGVIPVIFASSGLAMPQTISSFPGASHLAGLKWALGLVRHGEPLYYSLFAASVIAFSFFYVSIVNHPAETADQLRKAGGYIAGVRPGTETARYLDRTLSRLTLIGGVYLALLCMVPDILFGGIKLQHLPFIGNWIDLHFSRYLLDGLNVNFYFGGTSLLIAVGVAMDLINQMEAHLIMRHYDNYSPRKARYGRYSRSVWALTSAG